MIGNFVAKLRSVLCPSVSGFRTPSIYSNLEFLYNWKVGKKRSKNRTANRSWFSITNLVRYSKFVILANLRGENWMAFVALYLPLPLLSLHCLIYSLNILERSFLCENLLLFVSWSTSNLIVLVKFTKSTPNLTVASVTGVFSEKALRALNRPL